MTGRMRATIGDLDCVVERIVIQAKQRAQSGMDDASVMVGEMNGEIRASIRSENAGDFDSTARHAVEAAARATLVAMLVCLFAAHNTPKKVVH